ncbi:MAG: phytanoyl-CoA dioxygenase family protein [Novosphingobium sp.]
MNESATDTKYRLRDFSQHGFTGPLTLIGEPEMNRLVAELGPLIETERKPETYYSAVTPDVGNDEPVEAFYDAHHRDPLVRQLADRPEMADWASAVLDGPVRIWRTTFWIKTPGARRIEWHQDTYKDEKLGSFPNANVWIALDEATTQNCMCFVPGTHREIIALERFEEAGYIARLKRGEALPAPPVDGDVVKMPLRPGQCVLFDGRVLHGSAPNLSANRRIGLVVRFIPQDLELRHKLY